MQLKDCNACVLSQYRTQVVLGTGNVHAQIMIIGEAPGQNEDVYGKPFIGKAGDKLNWFLSKVGIDRKKIFITNSVKCKPPKRNGSVKPLADEIIACNKWVLKEVEIVKPRLIILAGATALKSILGLSGILDNAGCFLTDKAFPNIMFFCILHPASLLYSPDNIESYKVCIEVLNRYLDEKPYLRK